MLNTNTYDIVYDIDLRHRIRHKSTNIAVGWLYDIIGMTYNVVITYDIVGPTSYVTLHIRRCRCNVAYVVVGLTYDVVGQDIRRRR